VKVLVCGGRDYHDHARVSDTLDSINHRKTITTVIEGGARGADSLAHHWALLRGRFIHTFWAEWGVYGRKAGNVRNTKMMDRGKPDLVVAFPGGNGTQNMVTIAAIAGVRVIDLRDQDRDIQMMLF